MATASSATTNCARHRRRVGLRDRRADSAGRGALTDRQVMVRAIAGPATISVADRRVMVDRGEVMTKIVPGAHPDLRAMADPRRPTTTTGRGDRQARQAASRARARRSFRPKCATRSA